MEANLKATCIIEHAVTTALQNIKKKAPIEFAELCADPSKKEELVKAARNAAEERIKLATELKDQKEDQFECLLLKHLPKSRVVMVKKGLTIPTYKISIAKGDDGHHLCTITRGKKVFMPSRKLVTSEEVDETNMLQGASVLIEAILLVLQVAGLEIALNDKVITDTAKEVIEVIKKSTKLLEALNNLIEAHQKSSIKEMAEALLKLIIHSYKEDILLKIIIGLCSNMSWYEWVKMAAVVIAILTAELATDGLALIAKIFLALNSAIEFEQKLMNMSYLSALRLQHS